MLSLIPIILFLAFAFFFVGAVFDIDWIMEMTKADRSFGRSLARLFMGVICGGGIIMMIVIMIQ